MEKVTFACEKGLHLGTVARMLTDSQDLFAVTADPLTFARQLRLPSGPAIAFPCCPPIGAFEDDLDAERWDGLA
jgi:hypothetical protein